MAIQKTLRALADPVRREILNLLKQGRMAAGEIASHFTITGASVSRHLSVLKDAELIRDKREGQFIYYELNASILEETLLWLTELRGVGAYEKAVLDHDHTHSADLSGDGSVLCTSSESDPHAL